MKKTTRLNELEMIEVKKIHNLIEELRGEVEIMKGRNTSSESCGEQTKQFVLYKEERKVKEFSGRQNDNDDYSRVEEFIEEVKLVFETREMSTLERVDFILTHLEGPARDEIRLYPKTDQNDPNKLFEILIAAFGEKLSLSKLFKMFYDREQKDHEPSVSTCLA
jgi:hypothetical protein